LEKNRNRKGKSIVFLFSNKNINLILFVFQSVFGAAKSVEISNCETDDFPFTFSNIGKYQYHCQCHHPETMHRNIVVA
jgi:plastocyanin